VTDIIAKGTDFSSLSDQDQHLLRDFANRYVIAEPKTITKDQFRTLMRPMASTLKMPNSTPERGRWKLSTYWMVLSGLPYNALAYAVSSALSEMEWMPAPAILLQQAKEFAQPDIRLLSKAKAMVREHDQRVFSDQCHKLFMKQIPMNQLTELPRNVIRYGKDQGIIFELPRYGLVYRTRETVNAALLIENSD